jgi:hypothetical protein
MQQLNRCLLGGAATALVHFCIAAAIHCFATQPCKAIDVVLDYTYDSFFSTHPVAKATLETAAQDISNLIVTPLAATADKNTATAPDGSTCTFDFHFTYPNPATGVVQVFDPAVVPTNQVRIFVAMRPLSGPTLGTGSPSGFAVSGSGSAFSQSGFATALHSAESAANANMGRGGGPTIALLTGSLGGVPYTINFGSSVGSLSFDDDTNNDGVVDSDATLNSYWQFDSTTPVAAGKYDFYSEALHDLIHSIGFSSALSWNFRVSSADPRDWTGPAVTSLLGTGDNVLTSDSLHVVDGLLSTRLSDGGVQEAVMDPSLATGTRKTLTALDTAFLSDINWQVVPEPASLTLGILGFLALAVRVKAPRQAHKSVALP